MIFPLAAAVLQIVLNGQPIRAYRAPFLERGRVMVPAELLSTIAASVEIDGRGTVVVRRGDRFAQAALERGCVAIAPVLRALGARVAYDARARVLDIALAPLPYATATPFNPAVPRALPRAVFTPTPVATSKPVVTGKPVPRRTPETVIATPHPPV